MALLRLCSPRPPDNSGDQDSGTRSAAASPRETRCRARASSTSTIYFDDAFSVLDLDTLSICVGRSVMWHLRRGWLDPATLPAQYAPFTEIGKLERLEARSRGLSYSAGPAGPEDFPTADEAPPTSDPLLRAATDTRVTEPRVIDFVHRIAVNAKLEPECLVAALVYLERMMKIADPRFVLCHWNWRPVLLSVLLLGSKVWDDLSMRNADFCVVAPTFTLARLNELEAALLRALTFRVTVSAQTWAKYCFQLRSMMRAMGLRKHPSCLQRPLDLRHARRLHALSKVYQGQLAYTHSCARARSASVGAVGGKWHKLDGASSVGKAPASLEELVSVWDRTVLHPADVPTAASIASAGSAM